MPKVAKKGKWNKPSERWAAENVDEPQGLQPWEVVDPWGTYHIRYMASTCLIYRRCSTIMIDTLDQMILKIFDRLIFEGANQNNFKQLNF